MEYPYVVERYMAAVYRRRAVVVAHAETDLSLLDPSVITLRVDDGAVEVDWAEPARREALVERVGALCVESHRRHCVVFGPLDCVYVEPDGSRIERTTPPSGGFLVVGSEDSNLKIHDIPGKTTRVIPGRLVPAEIVDGLKGGDEDG